jgi:hypothetical protein
MPASTLECAARLKKTEDPSIALSAFFWRNVDVNNIVAKKAINPGNIVSHVYSVVPRQSIT